MSSFQESMKKMESEQEKFQAEFERQRDAVRGWLKPAKGQGVSETTKAAIRDLQQHIGAVRLAMGLHSLIFGGVTDNGHEYDPFDFRIDPDELLQEVCQYLIEFEKSEDKKQASWDKKHNRDRSYDDPNWEHYPRQRKKIRQTAKLAQRTILAARYPSEQFDGDSDYLI